MKYVEQGGDVRGTSANVSYMGVVFQGSLDEALAQAKAAPEHGVPAVNGRAELLAFLRVRQEPKESDTMFAHLVDLGVTEIERDSLVPANKPKQPWWNLSPYSLEYAMARWPEMFRGS